MAQIIRFADYEQRSREPDAVSPRDPADSAVIIVLPMIRTFNAPVRQDAVSTAGAELKS